MNPEMSIDAVPDNVPVRCVHCGRGFHNRRALEAHLQFCPKRIRVKTVDLPHNGRIARFVIRGNMNRTTMRGIYFVERHENASFLMPGACAFAKECGLIKSFSFELIDENTHDKGSAASLEENLSDKVSFPGGDSV